MSSELTAEEEALFRGVTDRYGMIKPADMLRVWATLDAARAGEGRSGNVIAVTDAEAKGPVEGWRWSAALRALHRHNLTYEEQPEGIRAVLAAAAARAGEGLDELTLVLPADFTAGEVKEVIDHIRSKRAALHPDTAKEPE